MTVNRHYDYKAHRGAIKTRMQEKILLFFFELKKNQATLFN